MNAVQNNKAASLRLRMDMLIAKVLIQNGADVNARCMAKYSTSICSADMSMLKVLIQNGACECC